MPKKNNDIQIKNNDKLNLINKEIIFEIIPVDEECNLSNYKKIPFKDLTGLGTIGMPIFDTINNIKNAGKSGLYYVNTGGGTLFNCIGGAGYRGGVQFVDKSIGQSILNPVVINPALLGIGILLLSISLKMDEVNSKCDDILIYFKIDKESKLEGSFEILKDILEDYKHYIGKNEEMISSSKEKLLNVYNVIIPTYTNCKKRLDTLLYVDEYKFKEIEYEFQLYTQSIELIAFSKFLNIILYGLFDSKDLKFELKKLQKYIDEFNKYKNEINKIFNKENRKAYYIFEELKCMCFAFDKKLNIPFPFFDKLRNVDEKIENSMNKFDDQFLDFYLKYKPAQEYVDNLKEIDVIYNTKSKIYIDEKNIYIEKSKEE